MKLFILITVLIGLAACAPKWHQLEGYTFEKFVHDFKKDYKAGQGEFIHRRAIFLENLEKIIAHNLSGASYKQGVNKFTDMTQEEFKQTSLGYQRVFSSSNSQETLRKMLHEKAPTNIDFNAQIPKSVDWRNQGVVSPVKDQGSCGSCWAFASAATLESHAAISAGKGKLKTLSTQQLVSCMPNPYQCGGTGGCQGAVADLAFSYASFYGLTSEFKYSYSSYYTGNNGDCTFNAASRQKNAEVIANGYARLPANNQTALLAAVAQVGPIAISVDASVFHKYEEGIFDGTDYSSNIDINHAVTLVGYGSSFGEDYWIVRNSWGTSWGEDGYIRIKREQYPQCGVDSTPLHGYACAGQVQKQIVCGQAGILSDSTYPLDVQVVG